MFSEDNIIEMVFVIVGGVCLFAGILWMSIGLHVLTRKENDDTEEDVKKRNMKDLGKMTPGLFLFGAGHFCASLFTYLFICNICNAVADTPTKILGASGLSVLLLLFYFLSFELLITECTKADRDIFREDKNIFSSFAINLLMAGVYFVPIFVLVTIGGFMFIFLFPSMVKTIF